MMDDSYAVKACLTFGPLRVCQGDVVIIVLSRGETIRGVFAGASHGFMALSSECGAPPTETIALRYVARVIVVGRCEDGQLRRVGSEDKG